MALPRTIVYALPLAILALPTILSAQGDEGQASVVAGSRLLRCLKTLEKAPNYAFQGTMLSGANPMAAFGIRAGGGQGNRPKPKPILIQGVRNGSLLCWTRQDGKEVLAHNQGRWTQKDRDGHWIPVRGPQGSWKNQQFTDPRFLAGRLRDLNSKIQWNILSGVTLDEQPVCCYESTISEKDAKSLFRSGALPAGGSMGERGQWKWKVFAGRGGRNIPMDETLSRVHIKIFEDPHTHFPLKIECEVFAGLMNFRGIPVLPAGRQDEEGGVKKPKPTFTYTLDFSQVGKATAKDLEGKALKILDIQQASPADTSDGAAKKRKG